MTLYNFLTDVNEAHDLLSIFIRTIIIFIFSIVLFRLSSQRISLRTPFDLILPFILGSLLSRGINGSTTLVSTILSSSVLIIMHDLFAFIALKSHWFGKWIKGEVRTLFKNGKINWQEMARAKISENDLKEELRHHLHTNDLTNVAEIKLERNGAFSFLLKETKLN